MKYTLLFLFSVMFSWAWGQSEMSAFTATGRGGVATTFVDDYQAIGINPSNLGWSPKFSGKHVAFSFLEGGTSIYTDALTKKDLWASMLGFGNEKFTHEQKLQAASEFASKDLAFNVDMSLFSLSVKTEKAGGFAFGVRDRMQWYSKLNQTAAELMFLGRRAPYFDSFVLTNGDTLTNLSSITVDSLDAAGAIENGLNLVPSPFSEVLNGTKMTFNWFREFNFSYGIEVYSNENVSLYVGAGVKYLQGLALIDINSNDTEFNAISALSPVFNIDYGQAAQQHPSFTTQDGWFPKGVGSGMGFDAGISAIFNESIRVGLAVNDIGALNWKTNVFKATDAPLRDLGSAGFDNYNIIAEAQKIYGADGIMEWDGEVARKVKLPTVARAGISYWASDKFEVGADFVLPLNDVSGNYESLLWGLGVDFKPAPWVTLATGFSGGGNYDFNIPFGVTFNVGNGAWEFGVASRDMVTFFAQNRPTLSLSMGFLRFRI